MRSVLQPQVPGLGDLEPVQLLQGEDVDGGLDAVVERLVEISYARVDLVEKRGEFAVRGGILDVFPPTEEHPVRVELWGDTVEEVRSFKVADQRSLPGAVAHGLWAPPCRELLLTPKVREKARALAQTTRELAEMLRQDRRRHAGRGHGGARARARRRPAAAARRAARAHRPSWSATRRRSAPARTTSSAPARSSSRRPGRRRPSAGAAPVDLGAAAYRTPARGARARRRASACPWWSLSPFTADEDLEDDAVVLAARQPVAYRGETERAVEDVRRLAGEGWRVVLSAEGHGTAERLMEVLRERRRARRARRRERRRAGSPSRRAASAPASPATCSRRWCSPSPTSPAPAAPAARTRRKRMPSRRKNVVDPLALRAGDPVVHEQHGVGALRRDGAADRRRAPPASTW